MPAVYSAYLTNQAKAKGMLDTLRRDPKNKFFNEFVEVSAHSQFFFFNFFYLFVCLFVCFTLLLVVQQKRCCCSCLLGLSSAPLPFPVHSLTLSVCCTQTGRDLSHLHRLDLVALLDLPRSKIPTYKLMLRRIQQVCVLTFQSRSCTAGQTKDK